MDPAPATAAGMLSHQPKWFSQTSKAETGIRIARMTSKATKAPCLGAVPRFHRAMPLRVAGGDAVSGMDASWGSSTSGGDFSLDQRDDRAVGDSLTGGMTVTK